MKNIVDTWRDVEWLYEDRDTDYMISYTNKCDNTIFSLLIKTLNFY